MNLIDELIKGEWVKKAAKSLNQEIEFSNLATSQYFYSEFVELLSHLATKYEWCNDDYVAWEADLIREPKKTIDVLRAIKRSWDDGKCGVLAYE